MRNLAPAIALSTALYGAGVNSGIVEYAHMYDELINYYVPPIPDSYESVLRGAFTSLVGHWNDEGYPMQTRLQILKGNDFTECHGVSGSHLAWGKASGEAEYCAGDDKVIMSQGFVNFITDGYEVEAERAESILKSVEAHELGHSAQNLRQDLKPEKGQSYEYHAERELQADCESGAAMAAEFPSQVEEASTSFQVVPVGDRSHGLPIQRYISFMHGATTGDCPLGIVYGPFESPLAPGTPED